MAAYYNEFDPKAAQWLRNLIARGLIAPGDVDERSIADVSPDDLRGYTQCHFFAGIGVWSFALRRAGWPDSRPAWTGSCPCQPFSSAGQGAGFDDERHLWPAFHWLISQRRPPVVFGEQVASKAVDPWVDLVQADMEALGYAFGGVPFPSAGVGAPHIRDRLYWVGYTDDPRLEGHGSGHCGAPGQWTGAVRPASPAGELVRLANTDRNGSQGCQSTEPAAGGRRLAHEGDPTSRRLGDTNSERSGRHPGAVPRAEEGAGRGLRCEPNGAEFAGMPGGMADPSGQRRKRRDGNSRDASGRSGSRAWAQRYFDASAGDVLRGPVNGVWRGADWLFCRDGKWRPVEPGTFPLADGTPSRVVRLRAYGNAINSEAATAFIEAFVEREHNGLAGRTDLTDLEDLI